MRKKRPPSNEGVGYRKPPRSHQFKKGKSGNPTGRPKGSKNLTTIMMDVAKQKVNATVGGRTRSLSTVQATAMQLAGKAAGGDQRAMNVFLDWIDQIETRAAAARPAVFPLTAPDVEVLRAMYDRMIKSTPKKKGD